MGDKAQIKVTRTTEYRGIKYQMGLEYTVDYSIARSLGSSCEILSVEKSQAPTTAEIKEGLEQKTNQYKAPKNAAILNNDKKTRRK